MRIKRKIGFFALILLLLTAQGEAGIFISEFLADPAVDATGDANGDGVTSSTGDEFVELFNADNAGFDLSGWSIADSTLRIRHVFSSGTTLPPDSLLVIFGGSQNTAKPENWQWASTGGLSLNNTGDEIFLYNNNAGLVDWVQYGNEANDNQSLARSPEGTKGNFILHTSLPSADGKLFSPGYFVNPPVTQAVPEPATALSLAFGLAALFKAAGRKRKKA